MKTLPGQPKSDEPHIDHQEISPYTDATNPPAVYHRPEHCNADSPPTWSPPASPNPMSPTSIMKKFLLTLMPRKRQQCITDANTETVTPARVGAARAGVISSSTWRTFPRHNMDPRVAFILGSSLLLARESPF